MKVIEIIVSPGGETQIQTRGFAGNTCLDATRELEAALGVKTADVTTGEFHSLSTHQQHQQQHLQQGESIDAIGP